MQRPAALVSALRPATSVRCLQIAQTQARLKLKTQHTTFNALHLLRDVLRLGVQHLVKQLDGRLVIELLAVASNLHWMSKQ